MIHGTFFGIDLTSTETRPSACVGLGSESQLIYFGFIAENRDIFTLLDFYSPQVIAIDAPLTFPTGLCCLEEHCHCRPRFSRKNRQCDQELRQQGIPCYPTSKKKTFIKDLIYRGIELKSGISREVKQDCQVIEVYPFASNVRLFGKTIPRKTTKRGVSFLRDKLRDTLPGIEPYLGMFNHDLCDAAAAAYTALLHHQNKAYVLGNNVEGLIIIPS
jgi:predicted nuclease with RNAse H fold